MSDYEIISINIMTLAVVIPLVVALINAKK